MMRVRCLVYNKLHASGALKRTDIATLAADDLAFQLFVFQVEDRRRHFRNMRARIALECDRDDVIGPLLHFFAILAIDLLDRLRKVI